MASQSVQCFGKKKTATGTTNPPAAEQRIMEMEL
jgi:hypothetical protein